MFECNQEIVNCHHNSQHNSSFTAKIHKQNSFPVFALWPINYADGQATYNFKLEINLFKQILDILKIKNFKVYLTLLYFMFFSVDVV